MTRGEVIDRLRAHESELRALGVAELSLFGSVARGDHRPGSDIDIAARFDAGAKVDMFRFAAISARLQHLLDAEVDLVGEPARKPRLQAELDRDRLRVF